MFKSFNSFFIKFIYLLFLFISINVFPVFSQTLDATFGNGGKVVSRIRNCDAYINDVAIQADGKIIVAGMLYEPVGKFLLVRYNIDGSIDSSFGFQGSTTKDIGVNSNDIRSIAIQSDGKIVAGGKIQFPYDSHIYFALVRFNSEGIVDSSFGNNGLVTTTFESGPDIIEVLTKVIVKPDGKILAGGFSYNSFLSNSPVNALLAQFDKNGSTDSSFGTYGTVVLAENESSSRSFTMTLSGDSKIICGGPHGSSSFGSMRFNSNGTIDNTFGANGFGDTAIAFSGKDEILQSDGKIVFAGSTITSNKEKVVLLRYNNNGNLDTTFGNKGVVMASLSNSGDNATSVNIDLNEKILVSGYVNQSYPATSANFAVLRYNSNGTLDSTWGQDGLIITDFSGREDLSYASVISKDSKIILAGISRDSLNSYVALAKYTMSVLPLKLLSFSAVKDGKVNFLRWQTAQEVNVDRFEIEKSWNGMEYSTIGKINAGSSKYNFTDNKPFKGINYYRLKMVDKDGKMEYSPVRTINNSDNFYVSVYPLPAKDRLNIQIQSNKTEKAEITVTDISGKTLITKSVSLAEGLNNSVINVQSLTNGVYFLKIVTPQKTETRKIVVGQ